MGNEPRTNPAPTEDDIGRRAVEVGLITAAQLRDVLLELTRLAGSPANLSTVLVSKGLLTSAQVDALSGVPLKRLGKYEIVRELGRGGMGVVYEAEDSELNRRVALKMLLGSFNSDPRESALEEERFVREARLCANLPKHPHVIGVYEAGILEGRRFIAMEFIEGSQFSEWRRQGSITLRQQVTVLRDAAVAVDHAHRHGIIHRDLKPANILIDRKNHPHVADFGLAKQTNRNATMSITASGMVMGTPAYMSPEQAHGGKEVDLRSDVWALGVMLYEILTGRTPFEADSPVKVLMKTVNDPVPAPSTIVRSPHASLDRGIEGICMKALAKSPRQRYSSARLFAEDLGRWLKGDKLPLGITPRKSNRSALIAGAAAAVVVAGLVAWIALTPSEAELAARHAVTLVAEGRKLLKQGKAADARDRFKEAKSEDPSNDEAAAGLKEAERQLAAPRAPAPPPAPPPSPAKPDPAKAAEAIKKELAVIDPIVTALIRSENYGPARDLLTQSARRREEEEWTTNISGRLEALRKTVDQQFALAKTAALEAKKRDDTATVQAARSRVAGWKWAGLEDELDLEISKVKKDPPPPATSGTLREIAVLKGSLNGINSLAVSVDGREILTTSWDDTVRIWDVQARETRIVLARSIKAISAAISPDGRWYAAGDYEGMIYLWDSSDPKTKKMPGHTGQLYGLAFTPDSKTLVSSSVDGNVCVWDVLTGLRMRSMNGHPKGALALSMSPDGRTVAVGSGSPMVRTWNIATGEPLKIYESADRGALGWPAYSPDGLKVAFGGNDGRLTIWEPETGTARDLGKHDAGIRAVAWSPDGRTIVTSSADDSLRFWDVASGAYTAQRMSSGYYAVGFSKKGNLLAAGGGDWTLHLFEPSK
ncbi:MAG TPA: serine/threonine-protein kinase [Planctomycetota bacterium]|nr:serine/threonine-protein kinase [Planctomycetota bacterium]